MPSLRRYHARSYIEFGCPFQRLYLANSIKVDIDSSQVYNTCVYSDKNGGNNHMQMLVKNIH